MIEKEKRIDKSIIYTHLCYENGKRYLFLMPVLTGMMIVFIFVLDLRVDGYKGLFPFHLAAAMAFLTSFLLHLFFRLKEPDSRKPIHNFMHWLSVFSIFAIATTITVYVQSLSGSITLYLICLFGIGVFIRLTLTERLVIYTLFHAVYIIGMIKYQTNPALLTANQINGSLIAVLGLIFSTSVFNLFKKNVLQEIELNKRQQRIIEDNSKLKNLLHQNENLMGILAHDIRNPLAQIKICLELMNILENENEKNRVLDMAEKSTATCFYIVDEVMDLKQSMNNDAKLPQAEFSLEKICRNLEKEFKEPIQRKGLRLNTANCDKSLPLYSNREAAQIILRNLVSNAVKFSPKGEEISISTKIEADVSIIEVKDNGPGFTMEDRTRLFTPFETLSAKPTGDEPSAGLGLSIIKEFCDKLGIGIELYSTPGQGSRFRLQFPKTVMDPESPGQKEA